MLGKLKFRAWRGRGVEDEILPAALGVSVRAAVQTAMTNIVFVIFLFSQLFIHLSGSFIQANRVTESSSSSPPRKYAFCFFGLTRSLYYTHHSIINRVFRKIQQDNGKVDIYLHTYNQKTISNPRSGENNVTLNPNEWRLLSPRQSIIDDPELFEISVIEPVMDVVLRHGDILLEAPPHPTLRNLLKQLFSLYRVTSLWSRQEQNYDLVFYLRPDVWFFNDINLTDIHDALAGKEPAIYLPNFHQWGGVNDRFAFGPPQIMKIYGNRYLQAVNYSQYYPLHAESFLKHLLESNNITMRMTDILFERVRSNGILWSIPEGGNFPKKFRKYQLMRDSRGNWEAVSLRGGLTIKLDEFA